MDQTTNGVYEHEPLCIKWKREAQEQIYELTKDMTEEELLAYYDDLNRKSLARHAAAVAAKEAQDKANAEREPVTAGR